MVNVALQAIKNPDTVCSLFRVVTAIIFIAMRRIIDGVLFESKPSDLVRLRAHEISGHTEISAVRLQRWEEVEFPVWWSEGEKQRELARIAEQMAADSGTDEEKRERAVIRAARRAKTRVRHCCKAIGADLLMTLTYQVNQQDLARCKAHLKEFVRRVYRVWPEFRAVAGFEQQKRGAWHVHLACARLPAALTRNGIKVKSFDLLRSIWRSVVGTDGGNVDVQRKKRNSRKSPARIAAYLSKYVTKNFADGEKWSNRWTSYGAIPGAKPIDLGLWSNMVDAMAAAYSLVVDGQSIVTSFVNRFNDVFWLCAEPSGGSPCITA